jgi:peroxiredoxin
MSLSEQLRARLNANKERLPADVLAVMDRATRDLEASGQARRAVAVGDQAPGFALPGATGATVHLDALLQQGPVVVSFYRGGWCPYCNLELNALQQHVAEFQAHGARLVAISPQVPDESLATAERNGLTFAVLSDVGAEVAEAYGLAFDLPDDLAVIYEGFGIELERVNGGHARTLPVPATYVIDRAGVVRWAHVNSDYTQRAEPADIVKALAELD